MASHSDNGKTQITNFHHPFTPYDVQLEFMRAVYDVLEKGNGQVGILESPTGTGKSLSLICGALTWLRNYKRAQYETDVQGVAQKMVGEPDWMIESALKRKREELARKWEEREKRMAEIRRREKEAEERASMKGRGGKRMRLADDEGVANGRKKKGEADEEKEFLIGGWGSADGEVAEDDPLYGISKETREFLERTGLVHGKGRGEKEGDKEEEDEIKIYYTSRTHSQLTQFISELRRPEFPPSLPAEQAKGQRDQKDAPTSEIVKQIPLSSRQKLCINPTVNRLGSLQAINDRCTEMQQSKSSHKCGFMPGTENLKTTHQFRDTVMATLPDIEDMFRIGKELQICPYYASRTAIPGAEVVTLPYPLLLQKSAREALGIKLEGNIVIIDEAHNIMDAVANVHAAEIKLSELKRARQMLGVYVKRFGKKLSGENRVLVAQVGRIIESLSQWLDSKMEEKGEQGIADPNSLLKARGADQINLYELTRYIQESKLAYKVESYASHIEEEQTATSTTTKSQQKVPKSSASSPVLHTLVSFLTALMNLSTEGRVFYEKIKPQPGTSTSSSPDIKLSYLLLSPTHAFSSIASSARAVILAGGTMSPFEDYKAHLFPTLPPEKITTLSCGHVIPASNLCVWTLGSTRPVPGTSATPAPDAFEFSFQKRSDKTMVRQLGLALLNICSVVPDGVVVFFPSYGYLDEVVSIWQAVENSPNNPTSGPPKSIWDRLATKKALFRESKGGSSDEILADYSNAILTPDINNNKDGSKTNGALLLSVVGGKMSEGINFSDRLGRCVVIVGLPYPNINSPEWKARIEYIESTTLSRLNSQKPQSGPENGETSPTKVTPTAQDREKAKQAARDFYENACMRAVNQSIGRAIRHRGDYAAIVLVDRRFGTERIKSKLPGWIRGGMVPGSENKGLGGLMGSLSGFFRGK
ncbi:ATP-dependent RNA helicase chl1, partial [Naviculisporaceae sp. PSN 640]